MTTTSYDLVIRGGTVIDGTGSDGVVADVAIQGGRIVEIGHVEDHGLEEIDASGLTVTPGFVDIHTHYDGQVIWSDQLTPSAWHGVTTVVTGNCGVGFAPCRPEHRDPLIALMEGVEDIPEAVMAEGLTWEWETFGEYLNAIERRSYDVDVCALVPHAPVRVYVMGERALAREAATDEDISRMRDIVAEAMAAGAFGVSTSRTTSHESSTGDYTPTLGASEAELTGLIDGLDHGGSFRGFFEVVTEMGRPNVIETDYEMMRRALRGHRGVFSLVQNEREPDLWRDLLDWAAQVIDSGVDFRPVVAPRSVGMLMGLESSQNPFSGTATYQGLAELPLAERVRQMRDPAVRARILAEDPMEHSTFPFLKRIPFSNMYRFGNPPNYTPDTGDSLAAIAQVQGRTPQEVAYDVLLEDDGMGFIYVPFTNYFDDDPPSLKACETMLADTNTIMGLGDGGAHMGFILDAGFPTFLLQYWVKERGRFPLPEAVRRLTSDTAAMAGLTDRGRVAVGMKADLNVIDLDRLAFLPPYVADDLPAGGKRLLQRSDGYVATIVTGTVTYRDGQPTGRKPGRLVRSTELA